LGKSLPLRAKSPAYFVYLVFFKGNIMVWEPFSASLLALWLQGATRSLPYTEQTKMLLWPVFPSTAVVAADRSCRSREQCLTQNHVQAYINTLAQHQWSESQQGVWIQSGWQVLASNQGTVAFPAASLTKIATSLAALARWEFDRQFETLVGSNGQIQGGVLQGDLIVVGGGDPLFVWEEAIAVANRLHKLGIDRVAGNLAIAGNFAMNYEGDPKKAGELLKKAFNAKNWPSEAVSQYREMPAQTSQPHLAIAGQVRTSSNPPPRFTPFLRHNSLPLVEILKQMNIYSNNAMAEMLAELAGGAPKVAEIAAGEAAVSPDEIQLENGSGLGLGNQISPRAACSMLLAIQRHLQPHGLSVADMFPVAGRDRGTLVGRNIPDATVVKTGTLASVSALAGLLPTQDQGWVCFATIARGTNISLFRQQQDQLLQNLQQDLGKNQRLSLIPFGSDRSWKPTQKPFLGDPSRQEVLLGG
jgi:D-alanyl-D-alanine carboxypeptidase/D-alanyl-D-alanine-endopeptidase (penicillin-binding protein 4)